MLPCVLFKGGIISSRANVSEGSEYFGSDPQTIAITEIPPRGPSLLLVWLDTLFYFVVISCVYLTRDRSPLFSCTRVGYELIYICRILQETATMSVKNKNPRLLSFI